MFGECQMKIALTLFLPWGGTCRFLRRTEAVKTELSTSRGNANPCFSSFIKIYYRSNEKVQKTFSFQFTFIPTFTLLSNVHISNVIYLWKMKSIHIILRQWVTHLEWNWEYAVESGNPQSTVSYNNIQNPPTQVQNRSTENLWKHEEMNEWEQSAILFL